MRKERAPLTNRAYLSVVFYSPSLSPALPPSFLPPYRSSSSVESWLSEGKTSWSQLMYLQQRGGREGR